MHSESRLHQPSSTGSPPPKHLHFKLACHLPFCRASLTRSSTAAQLRVPGLQTDLAQSDLLAAECTTSKPLKVLHI